MNRVVNKQIGFDIIQSYKRAQNIISSETNEISDDFSNAADPSIFNTEYEKNLYKKVSEINNYFSNSKKDENFDETLIILSNAKKKVFEFFDNVKVNEESDILKKNRLALINNLCKTFENFTNFQLINI